MGYIFEHSNRTLKDCVNSIVQGFGERIVDYSLRGQELYAAIRHHENPERITIVVFLIRKNGGCYGYKDIDEVQHPLYYNCPEKILKLSNNPNGTEWRNECRVRRKLFKVRRDIMNGLVAGDSIETEYGTVRYVKKYRNSKTQFVGCLMDSNTPSQEYRIPVSSITVDDETIKRVTETVQG